MRKKKDLPELAKILWYRFKVDNWSIKRISEEYKISKSTIYRWFKVMEEQEINNINEEFLKLDTNNILFNENRVNLDFVYSFKDTLKSSFEQANLINMQSLKSDFIQDLPSRYNKDYIYLLPIDPYWIFAYWEVNNISDFDKLVLKVFDLTDGNELLHMLMESSQLVGNMYIPVGVADRIYKVKLFFKGKFLMSSNAVRTPRDTYFEYNEEFLSLYDWYEIDQAIFSVSSFIINRI
ncbi:MAG: DUF4912 domain-containing protein [bacterium]|nr:DUF4912 domain-containing protein [bacterium]